VAIYPASSTAEKIHFHQINRKTKHRLCQQMVDETTGEVVDSDQKGRGYEVDKGRYVEIGEDELKAVQIDATHTIDIDSFVPKNEVDERYRDKPYYIVPDGKSGADAFAVIRDAMKGKDSVALGRIVLANRERVIAIEPFDKGMLGTTLRYPYEIRDPADYFSDFPKPHVTRDMVKLAEHILDSKAGNFDPSKFKDEYETALMTLVRRKAEGKTIERAEAPVRDTKVINLMDALKRSLASGRRTPAQSRPSDKPRRAARRSSKRRSAA
jgi:DNA end-binding protein Ku